MLSEYLQEFAAEQQDHIRYNTEVLKAHLSRQWNLEMFPLGRLGRLGLQCSDCEVPRVDVKVLNMISTLQPPIKLVR